MYLLSKLFGFSPRVSEPCPPHYADDFIAWLETKPCAETYNYLATSRCALAQYSDARTGDTWYSGSGLLAGSMGAKASPLGAMEWQACLRPNTFGALLKRVRKLRKQELRAAR